MAKRKSSPQKPVQKSGCENPGKRPASQLDVGGFICRNGQRVTITRIRSTSNGDLQIWTDDNVDITVERDEEIPVPA